MQKGAIKGADVSTIDPRSFRNVLGRFATGVGVVLVEGEDGPQGMTVNSFTSLSLEPPLVLFCARNGSVTAERIREKKVFSINILTESQEAVSRYFAGARDVEPGAEWRWHEGAPYVDGANASLICRLAETYPGGDHTIVIGEVIAIETPSQPAEPLLYYCGRYRRLPAEA